MRILSLRRRLWSHAAILTAMQCAQSVSAADSVTVAPNWKDVSSISKAAVSIEVCVEPPLRRGHPIHDQLFDALRKARAD